MTGFDRNHRTDQSPPATGRSPPDGHRVANLDNVQLVPAACLLRRAGLVAPERWPEFCSAMGKVTAC